jgi:hypothetical protein
MPSEAELMSTDRLKNLYKLTGDIEIDALKNLQSMLQRELKNDDKFRTRAIEIYDTIPDKFPRFPAICLDLVSSDTQRRTMGKDVATFMRSVYVDVWYYHADVNEKMNSYDVNLHASKIVSIIQRNADINGYCRVGVKFEDSMQIFDKVIGEKIIRGAKIRIRIPILYRDRAAGPG